MRNPGGGMVRQKTRVRFSRIGQMLLGGSLVCVSGLWAQEPLQLPRDPPSPFYTTLADISELGYMSVIPDKKVLEHANYPFDSLDADIARWENFLAQARQEVAALQASSDPNN